MAPHARDGVLGRRERRTAPREREGKEKGKGGGEKGRTVSKTVIVSAEDLAIGLSCPR